MALKRTDLRPASALDGASWRYAVSIDRLAGCARWLQDDTGVAVY
jgi:hypothetical protein